MADSQTSTVILQVKLDEGKTEEQLRKLVLDIEATRKAQAELTTARKAGQLTDEAYAKQVVDLKNQLKGQQQEQTALTKNLDLYRTATGELGNSYKGVQAQLSLAQRQFQQLDGSQDNSSQSAQVLGKTIEGLRSTLKATDETQGAFFRNVGNYPKGETLEPLIQQLIHLQEIQKSLPAGSEQAVLAEKQIGFALNKVNEQAAAQGKSFGEVQNKLKDYGERVRPATAELVKLERAQDDVAKSVGKESEAFQKIGFQIGQTKKAVSEVPKELEKISPAAEAAKAATDAAGKGLGLLGEQGEKARGLLAKFSAGNDILAKGLNQLKGSGETGALGFKALASGIALTGIGLFVLAISAVVTYFTQSAEGGKILAGVMGGLGAVVQKLTDLVIGVGKGIIEAVTNPKQAIKDLAQFVENQLINRFKAFGVILDAIKNRDFKQLSNGVLQLGTGVEDVIGKTSRFGKALGDAAQAGKALAAEQKAILKARQELAPEEAREESRVAVLLRLSKERGKTAAEQLIALKQAGGIEAELSDKKVALLRREQAAISEGIRQKGEGKAADLKADLSAKKTEIEQALGAQKEINAKIQVRESVFIQAQRTAAAAAAKQRAKDAVAAKQTENELALLEVAKGSAAELVLKQRAIDLAADAALAGEKKTADQVNLVRAQAEGDKLTLQREFEAKAIEEAKKRTAAQVAEAKREFDESVKLLENYLAEKRAQVERDFAAGKLSENQYQKAINQLEKAGLEAQAVVNRDYRQDNAKQIRAAADLEIREAKRVKDEKKKIEDAKQAITQASIEAGRSATDAVIAFFGEESAAGQAALLIKKELAIAELFISTQKQFAANAEAGAKISAEAPPLTIPLGIAYTITADVAAGAAAAASVAKILGFKDGGVLIGPSHEQGGIPFTVAGRPGFEAEGGEVVLTKGVWQNDLLRPMASMLNVMGGGAPLLPRGHMALGGVASARVPEQLRGGATQVINPAQLGAAVAAALRKQPPVIRWVDYKQAESRAGFTDALANG